MNRRSAVYAALAVLLLATLACGGPPAPPPATPTPTPAPGAATPTAPSLPGEPTATPGQGEPTPSGPQRVQFAPGATSAALDGSLAAEGVNSYVLGALAGQTMIVEVIASGGTVGLTVVTPSGAPLLRSALGETRFSGELPESGDYILSVALLAGGPATYTLEITINPLESGEPTGPCQATNYASLTAYMESSPSAAVFGTADPNTPVMALARTLDGWLGFDPGVAQAGNVGRARLRWYFANPSNFTFEPFECEERLPVVLSLVGLENGTYRVMNEEVTLTAGAYRRAETNNWLDTHLSRAAFGDMNGDGAEDAVVVLGTNTGGSGTFVDLALVLNQNGTPVHLTSFFVGDRTPVRAMSIADGVLTADLTIHDADDPFCCPTLEVTWQFVLEGGELVQVEE